MSVILVMSMRARRQAETLAAETLDISSRLSAVMGAAQSGIFGLNAAGQVSFANPSAHRMLGEAGAPVPFDWPSEIRFFDPSGTQPLTGAESPERRALQGEAFRGEIARMSNPGGGAPRHVRLASSVIAPEVSPEIASVLIVEDVTEQEQNREQAERASKLSAIGHLTGGVAHDFNNLLAVILGNLELIKDEEKRESIDRLANSAIAATIRGADLTRNMLAFARKSRLLPEVLELNVVVTEARNWIGRTLPTTVLVETRLADGLWKVSADRSSTESAILNLILNARDAMKGRGRLTIETANTQIAAGEIDGPDGAISPGRYVMLAVSDTGPGIPPEIRDQVFEPFFTTKAPGEGTGMGLSMVLGFMRQSGGTVKLDSELGMGTVFRLYFPATMDPACDTGTGADESAGPRVPEGIHILLAEDEAAVRNVLEKILTRAGYRVTAVESGDAALEAFTTSEDFTLLLTDIVMPGRLQGMALAAELRKRRPDLPVVFMSGYADVTLGQESGMRAEDRRLTKPVQRSDLLAAIRDALHRRAG